MLVPMISSPWSKSLFQIAQGGWMHRRPSQHLSVFPQCWGCIAISPLKNRYPCWLAFRLETRNTLSLNPRITLRWWQWGEILTLGGVCGHESSFMFMDLPALSPLSPPTSFNFCSCFRLQFDGHFLQETFPDHL